LRAMASGINFKASASGAVLRKLLWNSEAEPKISGLFFSINNTHYTKLILYAFCPIYNSYLVIGNKAGQGIDGQKYITRHGSFTSDSIMLKYYVIVPKSISSYGTASIIKVRGRHNDRTN